MNTRTTRQVLEETIERGRASAAAVIERAATEVPTDAVARAGALHWDAGPSVGQAGLRLMMQADNLRLHDHAIRQVADRAGVPGTYLRDLARGEQWQRDLAATTLTAHFGHGGAASKRYLVRSVNGTVKGFLSAHYRRLDSRPLIEAFAAEAQAVGAVPVDGVSGETRIGLRAILPQVLEPVPGEAVALGVEWSNSDYGAGAHSVRAFILRVWCANGATTQNVLSQVHLGRVLPDDDVLSQKTLELDTRTSVSALRDVVRGQLGQQAVERTLARIREAAETETSWAAISSKIGRRLTKSESDAAREAFDGPDVYNLPPGKTAWRASNALSWVAHSVADADRRMEVQRLAGRVAVPGGGADD